MKKVIFNYLPPSLINTPSPAFSILKSFIQDYNYDAKIIYWNLLFKNLVPNLDQNELNDVIPFVGLINKYWGDKISQKRTELYIKSLDPSRFFSDKKYNDSFIDDIYTKVKTIFSTEIESINMQDVLAIGFSSKFEQWIPAIVLAKYYKELYPDIPIIMGGFGSPEQAAEFLKISTYFDVAFWGEGEFPLLKFLETTQNERDYSKVGRIAFRNENDIIINKGITEEFINLTDGKLIPNFDDYFEYYKKSNCNFDIVLPIESSRGCHWRKCKFCFMNQGYKYREVLAENLSSQLLTIYQKYNIHRIAFLDNDLVGNNLTRFNDFLDQLIQLKDRGVQFEIERGEIITSNLDSSLIKKMALAGFSLVQIGYEATSDTLLKKMNKKQGFADNLFFVKNALKYGIKVLGANIICDTLDETEEDVFESIDNLHYLRFLLGKDEFKHDLISLEIGDGSRYFKMLNEIELINWNKNSYTTFLSPELLNHTNRFQVFGFQNNRSQKDIWTLFENISNHYTQKQYDYKVFMDRTIPVFKEYYEGNEIKTIEFDQPEYWEILKGLNNKVLSLTELKDKLNEYKIHLSDNEIISKICELKNESLIYFNNDYSKIVSIIDTNTILN